MVQYQPHAAFNAMADPARCAMIGLLAERERSLGELAAPFAMTLQGVRKHLAVLEDAGLVASRKVGRLRLCRLKPARLQQAARWLEQRAELWNSRLDRLGAMLEEESS
jgi:DNA-binding transcriptional ArsR family regulator